MNVTRLFLEHAAAAPERPGIWTPDNKTLSFGELSQLAGSARSGLKRRGIGSDDAILVLGSLGPELYAVLIGAMSLGARCIFVEPWMPIAKIDKVLHALQPKLFVCDLKGRLWGLRSPQVRAIPQKSMVKQLLRSGQRAPLIVDDCSGAHVAMISFTSGTTALPKGVVRSHQHVEALAQIMNRHLHLSQHTGADLCIFANFVLLNLALGKPSLLLGPSWSPKDLGRIASLSGALAATTLTCGPAFLQVLLQHGTQLPLRSLHVGGALTDCSTFEATMEAFPKTELLHIYGSSEAEPVAVGEVWQAVAQSRMMGWFQTMALGYPIPEISYRMDEEGLWIHGPNVCDAYVLSPEHPPVDKRRDSAGIWWHKMDDRIGYGAGPEPYWAFAGRINQAADDVYLEQQIYAMLNNSSAFIYRTDSGDRILLGDQIHGRRLTVQQRFPQLADVVEIAKIHRDRRHRARIDRATTVAKEAAWLLG